MTRNYRKDIVRHVVRNLLDVQLLRIVEVEPTWGYRVKKRLEADFGIKVRHGALYSTFGLLEEKGLVVCVVECRGGRERKVYTITAEGKQYLQTFYSIMKGQQVNQSEST